MRPIFRRIVPGVVDVGFEVRALISRAAFMASLTLRGWVGGRRLLLPGGPGSSDEAISLGTDASVSLRVVVVGGVTQNI